MPAPFLASRSSLLSRRPLVVGTLTGHGDLTGQLFRAKSPLVDLVELRLDTFPAVHSKNAASFTFALLQRLRKSTRKPVLLTLRSQTEDGSSAKGRAGLTDAAREALLMPLLPMAALVDVEARRTSFARRITSVARRLGVGVIHSYHDFHGARLAGPARWAARAHKGGADIFKVAVTPKTDAEVDAFLRWGLSLKGPRVLIGMGALSGMTRVVGFTFGSVLTYGHLGRSAAPGQMAAAELARQVRAAYGVSR